MFRLVDAVARSWYVVTHGISYNIYRISCKEKDTAIAGVQCSMFRLAIDWDSPCTGTVCKSANERKQTINHGNWNDRKEERKIERDCAMTHVYFCSLYYMTWHGIIFPRLTCLTLLSKTFLICRIWIEVLFCLAKYDSFSYSTNNDNDDVKWHVGAQTNKSDNNTNTNTSNKNNTLESHDHPKESERNANQANQIDGGIQRHRVLSVSSEC